MGTFVTINGVTYQLHGVLTPVDQIPPPPPPVIPAQDNQEWTPTMAANSSGGYVASATSEYSESGTTASAFKAFNGMSGSGWASGWSSSFQATTGAPQILTLALPQAKALYTYSVKIRSDANTLAPLSWVLEGYDGSAWQSIHVVSGLSWENGDEKSFIVAAPPGVYVGYRWRITSSGVFCQVDQIRLFS